MSYIATVTWRIAIEDGSGPDSTLQRSVAAEGLQEMFGNDFDSMFRAIEAADTIDVRVDVEEDE